MKRDDKLRLLRRIQERRLKISDLQQYDSEYFKTLPVWIHDTDTGTLINLNTNEKMSESVWKEINPDESKIIAFK